MRTELTSLWHVSGSAENQHVKQAVIDLFDRYENQTNAALSGSPDIKAISDLYDDAFVGASPEGVKAGKKDDEFEKAIAAGFARNREIGAQRMVIRAVQVEAIDAFHAFARVDWRATYNADGAQKAILHQYVPYPGYRRSGNGVWLDHRR